MPLRSAGEACRGWHAEWGCLSPRLVPLLLEAVCDAHGCIEHNQDHHRRVATAEDPASARAGESFWRFLPRTLGGPLAGAWPLERARTASRGLPPRSVSATGCYAALWPRSCSGHSSVVCGAVGAGRGLFARGGQRSAALRELAPPGRAAAGDEPVRVGHSWSLNPRRHSHHHPRVAREHPPLKHCAEASQRPAGYAGMILVALVPPLWRRLIDPRRVAWQARDPKEML
jgi:alkane 1-monooxygenase